MAVDGSAFEIPCGMVIAAVGQKGANEALDTAGLMDNDRVRTDFATMRTADPKVFAAGDGAFGGSTIVMAMQHGQRAAYYVRAALEKIDSPIPYRTPYRTRRVPVAQDLKWEQFAVEEPVFHGVGEEPASFPEIEDTYDEAAAMREAARCYRCDAETGSTDYSVYHREDLFSMARTHPKDVDKHQAMLQRRLSPRDNPYPDERPASLDDLVFLPANLSRLVIDPYREACRIDIELGPDLNLKQPFLVSGLDDAPEEIRQVASRAAEENGAGVVSKSMPDGSVHWLQILEAGESRHSRAAGVLQRWQKSLAKEDPLRGSNQLKGISLADIKDIDDAVDYALAHDYDFLMLDSTGDQGSWRNELGAQPCFELLSGAVAALRERKKEEVLTLIFAGGVRSGADAARLIAMGASVVTYGVTSAIAMGGEINGGEIRWQSDRTSEERVEGLKAILNANAGEASMMARCTGKTRLHNLEPEDLRSVTLTTSSTMRVPVPGHNVTGRHSRP